MASKTNAQVVHLWAQGRGGWTLMDMEIYGHHVSPLFPIEKQREILRALEVGHAFVENYRKEIENIYALQISLLLNDSSNEGGNEG